ncbi:MAG: plastocyanin/azurin family copper-binding protein [Actinomycetota bacterium]|nr:hypothetical protein [Actinomycetota bacterium]
MPSKVVAALLAALSLLVIGIGPVASAKSGPDIGSRAVIIRIHHSHFNQDVIVVRRGRAVHFVIVNDDPIDHEFIIGDEAVQLRHEKGTENQHGEVPGEVSVGALSRATTSYVFRGAEHMTFACHLPGHFAYGMHGKIRYLP